MIDTISEQGICKSFYGGNLVEIDDDNENNYLVVEVKIRNGEKLFLFEPHHSKINILTLAILVFLAQPLVFVRFIVINVASESRIVSKGLPICDLHFLMFSLNNFK